MPPRFWHSKSWASYPSRQDLPSLNWSAYPSDPFFSESRTHRRFWSLGNLPLNFGCRNSPRPDWHSLLFSSSAWPSSSLCSGWIGLTAAYPQWLLSFACEFSAAWYPAPTWAAGWPGADAVLSEGERTPTASSTYPPHPSCLFLNLFCCLTAILLRPWSASQVFQVFYRSTLLLFWTYSGFGSCFCFCRVGISPRARWSFWCWNRGSAIGFISVSFSFPPGPATPQCYWSSTPIAGVRRSFFLCSAALSSTNSRTASYFRTPVVCLRYCFHSSSSSVVFLSRIAAFLIPLFSRFHVPAFFVNCTAFPIASFSALLGLFAAFQPTPRAPLWSGWSLGSGGGVRGCLEVFWMARWLRCCSDSSSYPISAWPARFSPF